MIIEVGDHADGTASRERGVGSNLALDRIERDQHRDCAGDRVGAGTCHRQCQQQRPGFARCLHKHIARRRCQGRVRRHRRADGAFEHIDADRCADRVLTCNAERHRDHEHPVSRRCGDKHAVIAAQCRIVANERFGCAQCDENAERCRNGRSAARGGCRRKNVDEPLNRRRVDIDRAAGAG